MWRISGYFKVCVYGGPYRCNGLPRENFRSAGNLFFFITLDQNQILTSLSASPSHCVIIVFSALDFMARPRRHGAADDQGFCGFLTNRCDLTTGVSVFNQAHLLYP